MRKCQDLTRQRNSVRELLSSQHSQPSERQDQVFEAVLSKLSRWYGVCIDKTISEPLMLLEIVLGD